jgi:bacteriorhodopsin
MTMHFVFGYSREVPVRIEQKTSTWTLVAIAVLIVLAFILLSFEDVNEPVPLPDLTFHAPTWSAQADAGSSFDIDFGTEIE